MLSFDASYTATTRFVVQVCEKCMSGDAKVSSCYACEEGAGDAPKACVCSEP